MIFKYSQLKKRISYDESTRILKKHNIMHWGQLKLFLSELLYYSMFSDKPYTILYVGAAEGTHTAKLAEMFPRNKFVLYDPRKFVMEKRSNVELHNMLFTDEEARKYVGKGDNILFLSDIRTADYGESAKRDYSEESDAMIYQDMQYQIDWVRLIKPKMALLKFRTMYVQKEFKYLTGKIFLQHYSPASTETRLLTGDYHDMKTYNSVEFDERMAYYNCCIRPVVKSKRWSGVMKKLGVKNTLDMAMMLYIIEYYLVKVKGMVKGESDEEVMRMFGNIGSFFKKMNATKYANLFETEKAFIVSH